MSTHSLCPLMSLHSTKLAKDWSVAANTSLTTVSKSSLSDSELLMPDTFLVDIEKTI